MPKARLDGGRISRRRFVKRTLAAMAASVPLVVRSSALGKAGTVAPSNRIVMGCIGVGSMGLGHVRAFAGFKDVQVSAVCDVRRIFREKAKNTVDTAYATSDCAAYHDFRELLARDDIDAVSVATPDHWHALVGIEAATRGKAMFLEKPMDVNFAADKALRGAVNRYGVVFQFGTQQRSDARFRQACELARNGRLGTLQTIMVRSLVSIKFPNQPIEPPPPKDEFDYDMWVGPAPWAPYSYERCASRAMGTHGLWTHIHDYSLGGIGGAYGIHHADIAQWGNGTDDTGPVEIEGTGVLPRDGLADTFLDWDVTLQYANGVKLLYMGTKTAMRCAPQFRSNHLRWPGCGVLFVGTEGWVLVGRGHILAEPESLLKTVIGPDEIRLYASDNHRRNFLDCVKSGNKTVCPIETAVRSDTICHLSDIAIRLGRKLRWDPDKEELIGDDQANRMLARPLRSPWHL